MISYEEFKQQFNINLNAQQEQAVRQTDCPVLLLAVPGSGKTTTLVTRVGWLVYGLGVPPESILTMTYTVAASADMRARFRSIFGDEYASRLSFRTINSFCVAVINRYYQATGHEVFELIGSDDKLRLLTRIFQRVRREFPDDGDIKNLETAITYVKNMRLPRSELEELSMNGLDIAPLYDEYIAEMKRRRLMDYDDQLVYARTILLRYPDIRAYFQRQCRYVCVDEAQDSSRIQHEIIRLLSLEQGRLFRVVDEDQSIYGFRAAYPDALMSFEQDYPGAKVLFLEKNYRSAPEIVTAADRFIARNTMRRAKHMRAVRESGGVLQKLELSDRSAQYGQICRLIASAPQRQTAVLYRNNDSAVPLIDWLDRRSIAFRYARSDEKFFSNRTVNGVCDIIRLALCQTDTEAFMRVYYKLGLAVTRQMAERAAALCSGGKAKSLIKALHLAARDKPQAYHNRIEELEQSFNSLPSMTAIEALNEIRYKMGYGGYILRTDGDTERLFLLSQIAVREKSAASLLERLAALQKIASGGGSADCPLTLSTIHSSKGLEYERVILIDALDGILPSVPCAPDAQLKPEQRRALEEERRLFYVGATRAKNELILMCYDRQPDSVFISQFTVPPRRSAPQKPTEKIRIAPPRAKSAATGSTAEFKPGAVLRHKNFGRGKIIASDGAILKVRFADREIKINLDYCYKAGLISIEK